MSISSTTISATPQPGSPSIDPKIKSTYQPHLDGLRAIAILGVLGEHFNVAMPVLLRCGPLSVRFFFVLTGYFITLSLWRVGDEIAHSGNGSLMPLFRYYLARYLRIGPPFYVALTVGALLGIEGVRENFFWLATFQTNNYIAWLGYWPNSISHFWSLAVQEQFYLLWPAVVLSLPRRRFAAAMAGFILFGVAFRLICILTETSTITRWVTLFGCIDSFAVGALIAYLKQTSVLDKIPHLSRTLLSAMPLAAFSCFFLGRALMTLPEDNLWLGLTESCDAIFLAWLLAVSLGGIKGRYGVFLSWRPLVYLGRISYGVYVYHVFVIILISPLLLTYGLSETHGAVARLGILFFLTFALSSLSWHWLEQPFLAWKNALATRARQEPAPRAESTFA